MRSTHLSEFSSEHPFAQEEVMAYLDGEISAGRAADIAQHMRDCAACQALAASFRELAQQFPAWEIEASPAGLAEKIHQEAAAFAASRPLRDRSNVERTPVQKLIDSIRASGLKPYAWMGAGAMAVAVLLIVVRPDFFIAHKAALSASRSAELSRPALTAENRAAMKDEVAENLQALRERTEMQRMASSLENSAAPGSPLPMPDSPAPSAQEESQNSSPMIARTASLSLVVKDFAGVEAAVKSVVIRHSGYIGELSTSTPPDAAKTFSATLRVPAAQLDAALAELKQLGRADQETQAGEEVTKQYVDLAARLKNSRATEERLLDVLRHNTGKVKDVLEVENEISRVRGEIEEMEADQRALQSRIDFATITLSIAEEYKASLQGAPNSTGTRLHNSFVAGYHSLVDNAIGLLAGLLEAGPTLLLWAALLFFPVRWIWRRMRRAFKSAPKASAA